MKFFKSISLLVFILGCLSAGFTIYATEITRHRLPSTDLWNFFFGLARNESIWQTAFSQYENHRLVVVSFLTYLDAFVFAADGTFVYIIVVCLMAILVASACRGFYKTDMPIELFFAMSAVVIALVFSLQAAEGITMRYRSWVPLTIIVAALSHIALAASYFATEPRRRWLYLFLSCALGFICVYTGAPGLLIWPSIILVMLFKRMQLRELLVVIGVAAVSCTIFLLDFEGFFGFGRGGLANVFTPIRLLGGYAAFIGMPIGQALFIAPLSDWANVVSVSAGLIAIVTGAITGVRVLRRVSDTKLESSIFGLTVFTAMWLLATAIKHQPLPPGPWLPAAKSSDFMVALVLWSCLIVQVGFFIKAAGFSFAHKLFIVVCGLAVLGMLPLQYQTYLSKKRVAQEVLLGNLAAVSGVNEPKTDQLQTFIKVSVDNPSGPVDAPLRIDPPNSWDDISAFLLRHRLPPYDHPVVASMALKQPFDAKEVVSECAAASRHYAKLVNGYRLWGAVNDIGDFDRSKIRIAVVTLAGDMVGVGSILDELNADLAQFLVIDGHDINWVAYASVNEVSQLKAYLIDDNAENICRLF